MNDRQKKYREEITARMVEALKKGTAPWQRPWVKGGKDISPVNAVSGRRYNGTNALLLFLLSLEFDGGTDPRWATFLQAQKKGWKIRKGSEGVMITFAQNRYVAALDEMGNPILNDDGTPKLKTVSTFRYFVVFHASQIDGIPGYTPVPRSPVEMNEKAERILTDSGANIRHGGYEAFYRHSEDFIQLPPRDTFTSTEGYYATALHELSHWTGHSSRLNRDLSGRYGSEAYAREELVAEISSMFLSSETGIPQTDEHFQNHAAYVGFWISLLTADSNALFKAAADATKATEFLFIKEHEREQKGEEEHNETDKFSGGRGTGTCGTGLGSVL